jgi:RNA polymerase sigma-70 factor, ECF subfamily
MEELAITTWTNIHEDLKAFVYRKVKNKALAEDIVHDVFLKVHAKANQLKDASKISSWIYQITRHAVTDYYRTQSKTISPVDLDWEDDTQDFNDCVAFCLNQLVKTLPDKYRQALELTEIENLSQLQLADRLGISYSGAKSRVQRGRQMLKEKLHALYTIKTDPYGNVMVCEDKAPCGCSTAYQEQVVMP